MLLSPFAQETVFGERDAYTILLDVSPSMDGSQDSYARVLDKFDQALGPVYGFSDRLVSLEPDEEPIMQNVNKTNIESALEKLRSLGEQKHPLVILSDGHFLSRELFGTPRCIQSWSRLMA